MCDILSHLQEGWNESVKNKNKRNKISPYLTLVLYLASLGRAGKGGWSYGLSPYKAALYEVKNPLLQYYGHSSFAVDFQL